MKNIITITLISVLILAGVGGTIFYLRNNSNTDFDDDEMFERVQKRDNYKSGEGYQMGTGKDSQMKGRNSKDCVLGECLEVENLEYPVGDVSSEVKIALERALDDEYKAATTYEAIMAEHGNIRPFIMIKRAEEQHISSLKAMFDKYGLQIPENPYNTSDIAVGTVQESCQTGVEAEIANASLYDNELIPSAKGYDDIIRVFTSLRDASQYKHLPAFQRCS